MCGRYSLTKPIKTIQEHFKIEKISREYKLRFNIAPTQNVPVVISIQDKKQLDTMRWGLIPSWAKEEKIGNRMINARAETIEEKPSFKSSFKTKRCLVPTDGFIEWKSNGGKKIPQYIQMESHALFAFAGLWSEWNKGSTILRTFTIITTEANTTLKSIHPRMPVIISPESYSYWLSSTTPSLSLKQLLKPFGQGLKYFPVSNLINSHKNDSLECLLPFNE